MIAWLRSHPSTIRQISDKFFEGRYKAASHCLARLRKKGRIPYLSIVPREADGRPQFQYSGWQVGNKGLHEFLLTEFVLAYPDGTWVRGSKVSQKRKPDAEWNPGTFMNVELVTGHQSEQQFRERMDRYRGSDEPLLIVAHNVDHPDQTPQLMIRLMAWGEAVDTIALYVTLEEAKKYAWDAHWVDGGGHGTTLRQMIGKEP